MNNMMHIEAQDYWVKVVEMLQQNWALIEDTESGTVIIYFIDDHGGVWDEIEYKSEGEAKSALEINYFKHYDSDPKLKSFLRVPSPPYHKTTHPNGAIYSSGQFWI